MNEKATSPEDKERMITATFTGTWHEGNGDISLSGELEINKTTRNGNTLCGRFEPEVSISLDSESNGDGSIKLPSGKILKCKLILMSDGIPYRENSDLPITKFYYEVRIEISEDEETKSIGL